MSWAALEHAGYVPDAAPGPIGVFGGMYNATYYQRHLVPRPDLTSRLGDLAVRVHQEIEHDGRNVVGVKLIAGEE